MYSRNYGSGGRYNIPPGYVGSAFPEPEVKLHTPEHTESEAPYPQQIRAAEQYQGHSDGRIALEELIHSLRGKIGTEELIILLVMLLTASEGVGVETLILAAVLLAGRRPTGSD